MRRVTIANLENDLADSVAALEADFAAVVRSRERLERTLARATRPYYGITTAVGVLADRRLTDAESSTVQRNLVMNTAVGIGPRVPKVVSRLMLMLKIHELGLGFSAISAETLQRMVFLARHDLIPAVPSRGSVGASGDLAPLAHLALPLLGLGYVWDRSGTRPIEAAAALADAGLKPIELRAKEGLTLINGTQFMSAHGAFALEMALRLVKVADLVAAISAEAWRASPEPFDHRIQSVRPHPGQCDVAHNIRSLIEGSELLSGADRAMVQDPYSLRCAPQVHGAARDTLAHAAEVVEREINSVTDNPVVFEDGHILSGGNFHGQPLAIALDSAALAVATLANISERRIYLLLDGKADLPLMLVPEAGIHTGLMCLQYTAAALVAENKILAHPACVDSIPTCSGQEDHVSMGSVSALKLCQILENLERVLAIELIVASQALDYRRPRSPGRGVKVAHETVRAVIPHRERDAPWDTDLASAETLVVEGDLLRSVEAVIGGLR